MSMDVSNGDTRVSQLLGFPHIHPGRGEKALQAVKDALSNLRITRGAVGLEMTFSEIVVSDELEVRRGEGSFYQRPKSIFSL